jgi:SET domain-containing protein
MLHPSTKPSKIRTRRSIRRIEVRDSRVHGLGVYSTRFIPKGTRIIEYTGQRTSWEDAPNDPDDPHTFNFGLTNGLVINPSVDGNDARWINHSCDPNCEAIEHEDDRVYIYALRSLQPGEELFYDYGLELDEPITPELREEHACLCGSPKCRGNMLSPEKP